MRLPKKCRNPWTGETWTIHRVPNLTHNGAPVDGLCTEDNRILINSDIVDPREILITLLHEGWHMRGGRNYKHRVNRTLDAIMGDIADLLFAFGFVEP